MLKNYFKTAIRNLWKNKIYSSINIFGLAVGMGVALLIGLWVQYQVSFDSFHKNEDQIGLIMKRTFSNNEKNVQSGIMLPLYDELKTNYPEVKNITRFDWGDNHSLVWNDKRLTKLGHFADPGFLKMFSFPLVNGDVDQALNDPHSIVITESLAKAIFGDAPAIGKVIKIDNDYNVTVTAIAKDVPPNSSLHFDFLLPYEMNILSSDFVRGAKDQWGNNFLQNYVELNKGISMEQFSKRIENIVQKKANDKKEGTLFIQPIKKLHLYEDFKNWVNTGGLIDSVRLFGIIGILVLMIACINFMNLSTARSEKRAREVGIRKAIGSRRKQLIGQFLGESVITTFIAFLISLFLVKFSLPLLANIGFRDVELHFNNIGLLAVAFSGAVVTGLLAGSYPALYLSGFSPVKVLKGTFQGGKAANLPRKILVIMQFSFSIALIIGTIIVFQQIRHAKNRSLGYDPNNLIHFILTADLKKNLVALKQDLLATGYVEAFGVSSSPMTGVYNRWGEFSWPGKDPNSSVAFSVIMVDTDYEKVTHVKLKGGRFFSNQFATDSNAVVLNEAAVRSMGLKNPLGSTIKFGDENMQVIGVSENVVMADPFKSVYPAIMMYRPYFMYQGLMRLKQGRDLRKAIAAIGPIFEKYNPAFPFDYQFTDEEFEKKFKDENQIGRLAAIFAVLAIFISCLGLFGLASYMAERRTKEIGVRKVLGASVAQLWMLLSKDFVILVVISCVIASPLAYYFLKSWLDKYEFRIDISPLVFVGAAVLAIAITLVTISFQAIKAAIANPVKSLRNE